MEHIGAKVSILCPALIVKVRLPKYLPQQILALGQRLFAVVTREHLASDTTTQPRPTSRRLNQVHLVHDVERVAGVAATSGFREIFAGQELHIHWKPDVLVPSVKAFEPTIEVVFVVALNLQRVKWSNVKESQAMLRSQFVKVFGDSVRPDVQPVSSIPLRASGKRRVTIGLGQ
jgi:hypothetical protein